MSSAADRLEEMIADRPPILEVFTPVGNLKIDHQLTDEQKELLRNVAALVRACEAKQEDMQNAGQDFYGDDILAALAKLQEGE